VILRPRVVVIVFIFLALIVAAGYKLHGRRPVVSASAPPRPAATDLRQVMKSKLHEEYTLMSFTIWHDQPLTDEKMDAIAASSARIMSIARTLDSYETEYKQQGWNADDLKFFDERRLQLSRVAEALNKAARKHDSGQVVNFFMHMDNTCQSCHKRFRPDLSWT
jgi:cytochrome c556